MSNESATEEKLPTTGRVWASWFLSVLAWGLHLFASYGLVEWYCQNPDVIQAGTAKVMLHGLTLVCFGLAAYGTWIAWYIRKSLQESLQSPDKERSRVRSRFMGNGGVMLSGFLAVVILAQGVPNLMFKLCL